MCRAHGPQYRRCPSCDPQRRSAYRKASGAASAAEPIGPAKDAAPSEAAEPELTEVWQPERIKELADMVSDTTSARPHVLSERAIKATIEDLAEDRGIEPGTPAHDEAVADVHRKAAELAAARERWDEARAVVDDMGGPEAVSTLVGQAVACEAERRAGVTAAEIAEHKTVLEAALTTRVAQATQAKEKAAAALHAMDPQRRETPERKAFDAHMATAQQAGDPEAWKARREQLYAAVKASPVEKAYEQTYRDYSGLCGQASDAAQELRTLRDDWMTGKLRDLSGAYTSVLAETRELGGDVAFDAKSAKKAREAFQTAAQVYPSDWIEKANAQTAPLVKIGRSRAHYSHGHQQVTKKKVPVADCWRIDTDDLDADYYKDSARATWRDLTDEETENHGRPSVGEVLRMREEWDVEHVSSWRPFDPDRPPTKDKAWQMWTSPDDATDRRWRRRRTTMKEVESRAVPEVITNQEGASNIVGTHDGLYSVSTHELAHRMEYTVPGITRLESAFLERRTTNEDGERQPLVALFGGKKHGGRQEVARPDGFVNAYIGKEYPGERAHEVLSMGMQCLFSGNDGGLVGAGRYGSDTDMRAFILGALACASRKKA